MDFAPSGSPGACIPLVRGLDSHIQKEGIRSNLSVHLFRSAVRRNSVGGNVPAKSVEALFACAHPHGASMRTSCSCQRPQRGRFPLVPHDSHGADCQGGRGDKAKCLQLDLISIPFDLGKGQRYLAQDFPLKERRALFFAPPLAANRAEFPESSTESSSRTPSRTRGAQELSGGVFLLLRGTLPQLPVVAACAAWRSALRG
jgi:hypothetical protein